MTERKNMFLLKRYFVQGWLNRRYYDGTSYCQPYSAEDRLLAGQSFYSDYLVWYQHSATPRIACFITPFVDGGGHSDHIPTDREAERFRKALRRIYPPYLSVLYKIVLEEKPINPPKAFNKREVLYFNDEIKGVLCRGLDQLCKFYG